MPDILVRSTLTAEHGRWSCECGVEGEGGDACLDHARMHRPNVKLKADDKAFVRPRPEVPPAEAR